MAGTGIRNRWRRGSYLIVDDESGHTHYSEDIVERYDGILFRRDGNEDEIRQHPQLYVRALDDPRALSDVRPQVAATAPNFVDANIVQGIRKPSGAADHLYAFRGIGAMVIVSSDVSSVLGDGNHFIVR